MAGFDGGRGSGSDADSGGTLGGFGGNELIGGWGIGVSGFSGHGDTSNIGDPAYISQFDMASYDTTRMGGDPNTGAFPGTTLGGGSVTADPGKIAELQQAQKEAERGTFIGNLISKNSILAGLKGLVVGGPVLAGAAAVVSAIDKTFGISDSIKASVKASFNKAVSGETLSEEDVKNISAVRNMGDDQHAQTVDGIMGQNYGGDGGDSAGGVLESYANQSNTINQQPGGVMSYLAESTGGNAASDWQQQAVDYLIERDIIPNQFKDEALKRLGGLSGLEGGIGSQEDLIGRAKSSPLYGSIMEGQKAGEESILRNAAATGGLRSGNVQENLYDYNTQLSNKALLESYNQELAGLTGLAGLRDNTTSIAQGMSNVGTSMQSGINRDEEIELERQYSAQAREDQQTRDKYNNWLGIASLGVELFSDRRLKKNIKKLGKVNGFNWYSWNWNAIAEKLGLKGSSQGVIADEILKTNPDAISMRNFFMMVNYSKLGILGVQNA